MREHDIDPMLSITSYMGNLIEQLRETAAAPPPVPEDLPDEQWMEPLVPEECRRDVRAFYRQCLWTSEHNAPPEIHQEWYRIATAPYNDPMFLDRRGRRVKLGAAIAAPRGHAKTEVFSKTSPTWQALTGRKHFIVIISDTEGQAVNFIDGIRRELEENPRIRKAFPGLRIGSEMKPELKWTSTDLVITMVDPQTERVRSQTRIVGRGTGSRLRGIRFRHWRPDLIVGDDLENDELVSTPEQRKKTFDWFMKVVLPALDPKRGQLIIVGTILHYDSLLNKMLRGPTGDAAADAAGGFQPWSTFFQRKYQAILDYGQPTQHALWPDRYSVEHLLDVIKPTMTTLAFFQEYQNEPIDEGARTVQPEWIRWWHTGDVTLERDDRTWRFLGDQMAIYIGVDPAIEEHAEADWFALCVIGITPAKQIIVLYVYRAHLGLAHQVRVIQDQINIWNPMAVIIESNQAQKWLAQEVVRRGQWLPKVRAIKNVQDKYQRINATAPWWEQGQVYLRAAVDREDATKSEHGSLDETRTVRVHFQQQDFYEECMTFPMGMHDDLFDAWQIATRGAGAGAGMRATRIA